MAPFGTRSASKTPSPSAPSSPIFVVVRTRFVQVLKALFVARPTSADVHPYVAPLAPCKIRVRFVSFYKKTRIEKERIVSIETLKVLADVVRNARNGFVGFLGGEAGVRDMVRWPVVGPLGRLP